MSASAAIQAAIYARLAGYAPLLAVITDVHDDVPQPDDAGDAAAFPYVTIGEDSVQPFAHDDAVGANASVVIHSWSRYRGRAEIRQIQDLLFAALSRHELAVTGYTTITLEWEGDQSFLDADGVTRHGVSTYRLLLLP